MFTIQNLKDKQSNFEINVDIFFTVIIWQVCYSDIVNHWFALNI